MINFDSWIQEAIKEDIGAGDFSALACIPLSFKGKAKLLVKQNGVQLEFSDYALDYLAENGYDPQFGARPLHRAIQKYIEDPVAEEIINTHLLSGDTILLDLEEGKDELSLKIKKSKPSKKTK